MRVRAAIFLGLGATLLWGLRAVAVPVPGLPLVPGGPPVDNKARAAQILDAVDGGEFSNQIALSGIIDRKDIMAMFQIESRFDPTAINENDGGPGNHAYGIGQMLASTAADINIVDPTTLLNMEVGVRATVEYMIWIFNFLAPRLGRNPTRSEWIGAYNIGIGNVLNGVLPETYLAKHAAAKALL